jgi:hypothetical protein
VWRGRKLLLATVGSLVLGAAVVSLWARGQRAEEEISVTNHDLRSDRVQKHSMSLMSGLGGLRIGWAEAEEPLASGLFKARGSSLSWSREFKDSAWYPVGGPISSGYEKGTERQWHGFEVQSVDYSYPMLSAEHFVSVTVPDWTLLVPTAAVLTAWLLRLALLWRKRRRATAGRCPICNYSLAGNLSGTCPECGTPILGRQNIVSTV